MGACGMHLHLALLCAASSTLAAGHAEDDCLPCVSKEVTVDTCCIAFSTCDCFKGAQLKYKCTAASAGLTASSEWWANPKSCQRDSAAQLFAALNDTCNCDTRTLLVGVGNATCTATVVVCYSYADRGDVPWGGGSGARQWRAHAAIAGVAADYCCADSPDAAAEAAAEAVVAKGPACGGGGGQYQCIYDAGGYACARTVLGVPLAECNASCPPGGRAPPAAAPRAALAGSHPCESLLGCPACLTSPTLTCAWCPRDAVCHTPGSLFDRCAKAQDVTDPAQCPAPTSACAARPTCEGLTDCAMCTVGGGGPVGWSCAWCPADGQCHAVGSVYDPCGGRAKVTNPRDCPLPSLPPSRRT